MTKKKRKVGRPLIEFTREQVAKIERAAFCQSKDTTIAIALGISQDVFKRNFQALCEQKRAEGKLWLQQKQYTQASKNNTALLCFLGKNYLEQADKQEILGSQVINVHIRQATKPDGD